MVKADDRPDRFASGTGGDDAGGPADNEMLPGVTGGGNLYLNEPGREGGQGSGASSAEGTIGAVGEMDLTGAPVDSSGSGAGESEGGGPGGGAMSRGGTGPGPGGGNSDAE